jgi:hypothetical protein
MAVAAAPCEEWDGRRRDWWPPRCKHDRRQAVVLCRCSLYYSRRRRSDLAATSLHDLTNQIAGMDV